MSDLYWLSEAQMRRLRPCFPMSHGVPRVVDRRVLSETVFVNRNGLRWRDAPEAHGPHMTPCNRCNRWKRWKRWKRSGRVRADHDGACGGSPRQQNDLHSLSGHHYVMPCRAVDAAYLKAHRTASSLRSEKGARGRLIGRAKSGMNTKLHAVIDAAGRPIRFFMTAGPPLGDAGIACRAAGQR